MTTASWTLGADHQNDAGFRAWGSSFSSKLAAVGLTQTADTGQINWASVTRPGTNSDGGFEIWYMNDSLHGTAPIYIRFNYGTGGAATRIRINMIVGTSTNGSGTIGGTALTSTISCAVGAGTSTGSTFTSYMCFANGCFWFEFLASNGGVSGMAAAFGAIARTTDSTGAITATGATVMAAGAVTSITSGAVNQHLRFAATAIAYTVDTANAPNVGYVAAPNGVTGTLVGADTQAFPCFHWTPQMTPMATVLLTKVSELADAATATITPFGSTSHTYISTARQGGTRWYAETAANWGLTMIWE